MLFKKQLSLLCLVALQATAQDEIYLYPTKFPPNSKPCTVTEHSPADGRKAGITQPSLYIFKPTVQDSLKTAVIVCPGGGYARLAIQHEGFAVAQELANNGITAFVLQYRNPIDSGCFTNKEIVALQDAQQAIALVRAQAATYNININRVGILGFSAGGHLAATASTHFNKTYIEVDKNINLRPDFSVLIYPVISFKEGIAHMGSRNNLLGKEPTNQKINEYSNELQVTPETPPAFLVHAGDDKSVVVQNSLLYYTALLTNKVAAELHLYQKGGHGFGLHNKLEKGNWFNQLLNWLLANNFIRGNVL